MRAFCIIYQFIVTRLKLVEFQLCAADEILSVWLFTSELPAAWFPSCCLKPLNSPVVSCEELKVPLVYIPGLKQWQLSKFKNEDRGYETHHDLFRNRSSTLMLTPRLSTGFWSEPRWNVFKVEAPVFLHKGNFQRTVARIFSLTAHSSYSLWLTTSLLAKS